MNPRAPAAALLGAFALAGCVHVGSSGIGGAQLHPWTTRDSVRIGLFEEPDTLNPVITEMSFASDVNALIYDGLIRFDERGRPVPDLAVEVPTQANGGISPDGKTITYHLVHNATWHDGKPLTAQDVIFTWHAIMNPANNTPTHVGYDRIASIEAPDAYTVRLHFRTPYAPAIYLFKDLSQGSIMPAHLLANLHDINRAAINAAPVGSGPYVFERWLHGNEITLHANPNYFGAKPKIEHVIVKFIPNQNTLVSALRAHDIDVFYGVPPLLAAQVNNVPGVATTSTSTFHWEHLNFNTAKPPLDDVVVRRALCMAIDEKTVFRNFYHGYGRAAPVHFNPDFGWGDPSLNYLPFDPKAAGALLDGDGWKLGSDGYRYKNGTKFAFDISTVAGVKAREAIEVFLQSAWRGLGADVNVVNYQAAMLFAPKAAGGLIQNGKTDVALYTWENVWPDPDDSTYVNSHDLPPNGQNDSFYQNPQIDALEESGLTTFDDAKRHAVYKAIAGILLRDVPEYVLDWEPEIVAYNDDLVGVKPEPVGSDLWNVAAWTYK